MKRKNPKCRGCGNYLMGLEKERGGKLCNECLDKAATERLNVKQRGTNQ